MLPVSAAILPANAAGTAALLSTEAFLLPVIADEQQSECVLSGYLWILTPRPLTPKLDLIPNPRRFCHLRGDPVVGDFEALAQGGGWGPA
jgi:hypothetical protein